MYNFDPFDENYEQKKKESEKRVFKSIALYSYPFVSAFLAVLVSRGSITITNILYDIVLTLCFSSLAFVFAGISVYYMDKHEDCYSTGDLLKLLAWHIASAIILACIVGRNAF